MRSSRTHTNKALLSLDLFHSQSSQQHQAKHAVEHSPLPTNNNHAREQQQLVTPAQLACNDPVKLFELKQREEYQELMQL